MVVLFRILMSILAGAVVFSPAFAWATQGHVAPEGIYVHQISHFFFVVSMVILIYWLRGRKLTQNPGWRLIQFSALFFILWNVTVIGVHLFDEQLLLVIAEPAGAGNIRITPSYGSWLAMVYYIGKMDHFLCVPAMVFLYLGLKRLRVEERDVFHGGGS